MLNTTCSTLIKLAAIVWYTGVAVLVFKSGNLFFSSLEKGTAPLLIVIAVLCGIVIGKIKAKYLFSNICIKNIKRINLLVEPKLWQFYRKRFFVFLFLMISLGEYLSAAAQGKDLAIIALAVLELSIGLALFFSGHCFWKKQKN